MPEKTKIIIDTNVPVKAATPINDCPSSELGVQKKCMEFINEFVISDRYCLVLDCRYEILREYERNISKTSSMGIVFRRWLYTYIGQSVLSEDFVALNPNEVSTYDSFPLTEETKGFDISDRKFVALANAHPEKPPIIEGTDGKWIGYENAFSKYGIKICFLDREYAEKMYQKKCVKN